ncbi:lytic polysaccharide monooxygenase [Aaosphaeria arxii CBS 175.79]|uniref:Lytic polysaccharide monooxygenase n=1 Tax=Aaosphaeria arxii CBS 175.79 TaxID=1450172 RepID=A0A6A5Y8U0_9PLEO|nr:lytic polysaccharide monooxygenase [Aaosphaeria arxii CBS 175.79]KAF2021749.1 lytic polysaccharide monooxygenase [Aaosphaeria arxii CBS 175.79]
MSLRNSLVAASAFLASVNAHMIMKSPVPYSADKVDSAPITAAQFPCKSNLGFTVSTMNNMAVGEKQTLSFTGTAVHGGGSCQLSVTTDTEPNANSKFKVIKSIEGGCPGVNEQVNTYDFELPDSIPNGKATFAWTWFAKLSGGPEMYMNCAPIEVTGGASDTSKFDELPDMLVANLGQATTCKSPENKALKFPNPGSNLQNGGTNDILDPTGECGTSGTTPPQEGNPSSAPAAQPSSPATPEIPIPTGSAPAIAPTAVYPTGDVSTVLPTTNPGGIFAPSASSAAPLTSTQTTLVTVTAKPSVPGAGPTQPSISTPAGTGNTPTPTGPSAPGGGSGTCSEEGSIVCNGPDQFGLCNHGQVVWQQVAAGTTCSNGSITKRGYYGRIARPRWVVVDSTDN